MFTSRTQGIFQAFQASLVVISVVLYWSSLSFFVTFYDPTSTFDLEHYTVYGLLIVAALVYTGFKSNLNKSNLLQPSFIQAHQSAFTVTLRMDMLWLVYNFSIHYGTFSRVFLFSFSFLFYLVMIVLYRFLPPLIVGISFRGLREQQAILFGSASRAESMLPWIKRKEKLGLRILGFIPSTEASSPSKSLPVLGRAEEFERILTENRIGLVIFLDLFEDYVQATQLASICETLGVRLLIFNDLEERIGRSMIFIQDDDMRFVALRAEPLENPFNRILKRLLDIFIASVAVFIVLPIPTLIVWLCQRWQSPGPLFYKQKRAGLHHEVFEIYKFRTMHVAHGQETKQATTNDRRIYPAGALFRRFSIDELPQFWNVLRGEMSAVGPRPHMVEHNDAFSQLMKHYHVRTFVKPGITGLAQVRGFRGETKTDSDLKARIDCDVHYIENWTLAMDIMIILRTVIQVFIPPRSAY